MNKKRELLAAGIVKDYRFSSWTEYENYLEELEGKKIQYKVLETFHCQDETVLARVTVGYNNRPLIELYE